MRRSLLFFLLLALPFGGFGAPLTALKLDLGQGTPVNVWVQGEKAHLLCPLPASEMRKEEIMELTIRDENGEVVLSRRLEAKDFPAALPEPKHFGPYHLSCTFPGSEGSPEPFQRRIAYIPRPATGSHGAMQYGIALLNLPIPLVKPGALACQLAGADFVRSSLSWKEAEPAPGKWNWSYYDDYFGALKRRGLRWAPILWYAPEWGQDKSHSPPLKPESGPCRMPFPDRKLWADFIDRALERYGKDLRTVEVWNEPDLPYFADFTPEEYAELLKDVRRIIRQKGLPIRITTCGFTCLPGQHPKMVFKDYMPRALAAAKGAYDCHSIHLHGGFTDYKENIDRFLRLRQEWGVTVPWAANETAVSSSFCSRKRQASILFEKMVYSQAKGARAYVWHNLRDLGRNPKNAEHNYGLMDNGYEPKEAFSAYAAAVRLFRGAEVLKDLSRGECICLVFRRDGELLIPVWNFTEKSRERALEFSGVTGRVFWADLYGNRRELAPRNGTLHVPVSEVPGTLLLEQLQLPVLSRVILASEQENVIRLAFGRTSAEASCLRLDRQETYHGTAPADPSFADCVWRGADDCSVKIQMNLEGSTLQVKAEVKDDIHTPIGSSGGSSGDKVQLFFAPQKGTPLLKFSLTLDRQGKAQVRCKEFPAGERAASLPRKSKVSVSRDDHVCLTSYELHFPATEACIRKGEPFRFNIVVFDDDGRVREGYHSLVPMPKGQVSDGTGFPLFLFQNQEDTIK